MPGVLVRLPNWLGDLLMARPLLAAVRAAGNGPVTALGAPALTGLLAADGAWDVVGPARGHAGRHDLAIVCPPSFSSAWQAWRSGSPRRIGFAGEWREAWLTDAVPRPPRGDLHLSREYLALAAAAGLREVPLRDLTPPPGERPRWERPHAVLGPGAVYGPAKRWPARHWIALGRRLTGAGLAVAVCGAAGEADLCTAVASGIGSGAESWAGRTDLPTQARICRDAALAVCNDSGLAHLAAAVGAPTIVVFGSTSSAWTAPLGPRVAVVQRAPVCAPCFARTCRIGYACLEAVTVDAVWAAAHALAAVAA
jgi:heptosyltransferase-2